MKQKPNRAKKRNPADVPQYGLRKIRRLLAEHATEIDVLSESLYLTDLLVGELADRLNEIEPKVIKPKTKRGRR